MLVIRLSSKFLHSDNSLFRIFVLFVEKFSGNGSTLQQLEFSLQISKPASSSVSAKSSFEVPILILLIFPGGLKLN